VRIKNFICFALFSVLLVGQTNPDYHVITTSRYYLKVNEEGNWNELNEMMEEEFSKINQLDKELVSLMVLGHRWSGSWNEVIQVAEWKSIADADKSTVNTANMRKKAWPNDQKRKAFFEKYGKYWENKHSDLAVRQLVTSRLKRNQKRSSENTLVTVMEYYMKPLSEVEGGTVKEREDLFDEYFDKVIMKNDKILSRREMRHYWSGTLGGGSSAFVVMTEYGNITDADNTAINRQAILKAWPDEDERKAFFEKRNKYLAYGHRDIAIHNNMVKLNKR
jgi:hypothetical protein